MTTMTSRTARASVVETINGNLCGTISGNVHVFRGVRYGETTAGAYRFLPPRPVENWSGIRDALTLGAAAPQHRVPANTEPFFAWYSAITSTSEDCLFLNVFTPGLNGGKRPVMFWIHGGGWREYSGGGPGFDGTDLAQAQDVVVVTMNHRLNGFGYVQLEDSDERFADSGNVGLLDVVAALKWVRANIARFGGDPGNVTLFGESGGASKLCALLAMQAAHGLFHKAIVQSTGDGMQLITPEEAAKASASLARTLGLPRLTGEALQKIPMEALVEAIKAVGPQKFRGILDERSFHAHPFDAKPTALSVDVPMLFGCTDTETTYYLYWDQKNFSLGWSDINRRLARFLRIDADRTEAIIQHYRQYYASYDASNILIMITSDFIFKRNTYHTAQLQASSANVPIYTYLFDHQPLNGDSRMRSAHTIEVPYIFGTAESARAAVGDGQDVGPMTHLMQAAWASFARTGNPNTALLPEWKPYSAQNRQMMVLNLQSHLENDPGGEARAKLDFLPYFNHTYGVADFCSD